MRAWPGLLDCRILQAVLLAAALAAPQASRAALRSGKQARISGPAVSGAGARQGEPRQAGARRAKGARTGGKASATPSRVHVPTTVPALLARTRPARDLRVSAPGISMEHVTSHATYLLRPDLRGGGFSGRQMQAISSFLRCHHTGRRRAIEQRLVSLLYATARHFNNAKLFVIAGYRAPQVARMKGNPKSPHKRGVACDFRLEGVPLPVLRDYLRRTYDHVGVGYYPNSGFVHLDVGRKKSAFWVDYSAPGERARYAGSPETPDPAGRQALLPAPPPAQLDEKKPQAGGARPL